MEIIEHLPRTWGICPSLSSRFHPRLCWVYRSRSLSLFPSFLVSRFQQISAGHPLAIPLVTLSQQKPLSLLCNTRPFSHDVLPSPSHFLFDFRSFNYCRDGRPVEITLHLPVRIGSYCDDSTALTSSPKTHYGPLCTSRWCRSNRLQTRGPDLVLCFFRSSLSSRLSPVGVVEPGILSGRISTTSRTQVSPRFGLVP